jgi:hypothetical protein
MGRGGDRSGGRRPFRFRAGALLLMTASLLIGGGVAQATTGALELVHPPRVVVPYSRAEKFQGRFILSKVGSAAQIHSGGMKIEFAPGVAPEFLIGAAQFEEYNEAGQIETGLFTLYPFRQTTAGVVTTILKKGVGGPGRTPPLGTLRLDKPTADGQMKGTIELHGGGPYPVVFTELAESEKYDHSPPAGQIHESAAAEVDAGWSADPTEAEGEYELVDPAPNGSAGGAQLGPIISLTQNLAKAGARPTGGDLTVLRGEVPTAEVDLELGSFTRTFYLTDLSRHGDQRVATVRGGSPTGPKVGRFTADQGSSVLKGTLTASGSTYLVSFEKETR